MSDKIDLDNDEKSDDVDQTVSRNRNNRRMWLVVAVVAAVGTMAILFLLLRSDKRGRQELSETLAVHEDEKAEVKLSLEALEAAKIEIEGVTQRPAVALLKVTGTVEPNPQHTQQATPLVSGRVERVNVAVGDRVGAVETKAETTTGLPQLQVKADRAAIARYGLNVEDVNDLVESIVAGKKAGEVIEGEQRFDLVLRLNENAGQTVDAIKSLLLTSPNGARVQLSDVADVSLIEGAAQISRDDTRRRIVVSTNVRDRDVSSFVEEAKQRIEKEVQLPPGYYLKWGGAFENLERATSRLLIVVPIALFLIFVLLFSTFGSARQALLIYSGIPFAIVGGVFALALRGMPFSISAGVGFIALFGVAVLNGVVMVSYINKLRDEGRSVVDAVREGADSRLRPVLMTALVASLGFVPMALATSAGAEIQRPLATVVIGGLITSTVLTLLILPTFYGWLEPERVE